ncbi:MAG: hypothetical protein ACHBN1_31895 [Heteroscytonema crispum UTEX LB 1556]
MKLDKQTEITLPEPCLLWVSQLLTDEQIEVVKSRWNVSKVMVYSDSEDTFFKLGQEMGQTQLPEVVQWLGGW